MPDRVPGMFRDMKGPTLVMHFDRYRDGNPYALDIVLDDSTGLGLPSRREAWTVFARDDQEAHKTVAYHFFGSALWYRLAAPTEER